MADARSVCRIAHPNRLVGVAAEWPFAIDVLARLNGLAHGRPDDFDRRDEPELDAWHGRPRIRPPLGHAPIVVRHRGDPSDAVLWRLELWLEPAAAAHSLGSIDLIVQR